ncbi:MAG: hypothetical protein GC190_03385 [Alphaproteobacteria bacterium]|nr:hypothetical protein [Alphaproteobacteria bacterium]
MSNSGFGFSGFGLCCGRKFAKRGVGGGAGFGSSFGISGGKGSGIANVSGSGGGGGGGSSAASGGAGGGGCGVGSSTGFSAFVCAMILVSSDVGSTSTGITSSGRLVGGISRGHAITVNAITLPCRSADTNAPAPMPSLDSVLLPLTL